MSEMEEGEGGGDGKEGQTCSCVFDSHKIVAPILILVKRCA